MIQKQTRKDKIRKIWFYLTCWLPVTRYQMMKMYQTFIKFGMAVEKDHIRFQKDITEISKIVKNTNHKDKENIEKGMYE